MFHRRALAKFMAAAALLPARLFGQNRPPLTRIAFGSCADQAKPQPIWDAILAYHPDLFIFMGDNVYGDFNTADAANLRRAYTLASQIEGYNRLRDNVSHLAVWDDHDYGINDGGGDFPHKTVSKELFLEFWNVPASDVRRTREGIYDSHIIGPPGMRVQVILLDLRWFRSPLKPTDQRGAAGRERYLPDPDPAKTMLGATQWGWLSEELRKPAELRLLVSSTARPDESGLVPSDVAPSKNSTEPVGEPAPGGLTETVAVSATLAPNVDGFGALLSAVDVLAWFTV